MPEQSALQPLPVDCPRIALFRPARLIFQPWPAHTAAFNWLASTAVEQTMSKPDTSNHHPHRLQAHSLQTLSIRDELERLAWLQNPRLAERMANRRVKQQARRRNQRSMRWQDRILLSLSAVLLAVLLIRVESAVADEPLWLIARLPAEPTTIGLCGELNGRQWQLDINSWDAANSNLGTDNLAILWARKKIEALEDGLMFGADRELTQLEITDVALEYGLLTRHTSLVAVDKTPRRSGGDELVRTDIPGLLPAGASPQLAGYPSTATGWLSQLLLSLFVLLLSASLLWFSGSRLPMVKA